MSHLAKIMEQISAGDTLRDTSGGIYVVRGFYGHGAGEKVEVERQQNERLGHAKERRAVSADVVAAMLGEGNLWLLHRGGH